MGVDLVLLASAFAFSLASAFIPVLNIEVYVVGLAAKTDVPWLWLVVVVSTGQTLGKLGLFWGARYAKAGFLGRRGAKARHEAEVLTSEPDVPADPDGSDGSAGSAVSGTPAGSPSGAGTGGVLVDVRRPALWRRAWSRIRHWVAVGCSRSWEIVRRGGWGALAILFLASAVGFPPLYATAVLAGATSMRTVSFVVVTWVGRVIRFAGLLLIPLWFG